MATKSNSVFQKRQIRKEKEFLRRKAQKAPYETVLIICEDSHSSPNYFKEIIKYFRLSTTNIIVIPSKGSAPISVIEHAIELARTTPDIDRIACVFDRDEHESYERAIAKINHHRAKRGDKSRPIYEVIASTPLPLCAAKWH